MLRNALKTGAIAPKITSRLYSSLPLSVKLSLPNGVSYEQPTGLFINNEFVPSVAGNTFSVISPSTEEEVTHVYEALSEDVDLAVKAAKHAFEKTSWATADPLTRADVLNKLAALCERDREILASIETLDNGKSLLCARNDVTLVINYFKSCAGWADKITGSIIETGNTHFNYTRRQPIGVCGQIIPWNFPLLMASWKLGPILATGCTTVLKTAENTPLGALYLAKLIKEAGVPAGVVNIVSGFGKTAGNHISSHPDIKKIAFTGSTPVGRIIMKAAAESNLKKVTLELGGKSPSIVFDDADVARTIPSLVNGIFYNTGEICSASSRIYVQEGIYDELLAAFKETAENLKIGAPFDEDIFMGAQTSRAQLDKILKYVEIGVQEGARLVTGGERLGDKGFFIKPTIFADVTENMKIVKDEIFGPVVTIHKFKTVDEVVNLANDTDFGLAAGVHTSNVDLAISVANRIEAGTIWVNTYNDFHGMVPFGGFGQSGIGREMGAEALDNYTQVKAVRIALAPKH